MKTLAVYNSKGGVGKTSAAVNLGYLAARDGARVLIWDLDPQGAATYYFRVEPKIKGGTKKLVRRKSELAEHIKGTDFENLDILPSDFSYRKLDLHLHQHGRKSRKDLRKWLKPIEDDYDYVFIDCRPGISLITEHIVQACDSVLVPLVPTTLSVRTLDQMAEFCRKKDYDDVQMLPFFSMVNRRKKMHCDVMKTLPKERGDILRTRIPDASDVEKMGLERRPVSTYAEGGAAAKAYRDLWQEVKRRAAH